MNTLIKNKEFLGLFSDMFNDVSTSFETLSYGYPRINSSEDENNFKVDVYYPGLKKENFKIKVENKTLSICSNFSEKKEEVGGKFHFQEFSKREFNRRFVLPEDIVKSGIKASYEDGVLKIVIPKDKKKEKQSNFEVNIE